MVPPATGLHAVVSKYCVLKLAVYVVAAAGAVTLCDAAPASDQLAKTNCVPVVPACVAAAIVWLEPGSHWNVHGAVHAVPSTASDRPGGVLVTVMATVAPAKLAVTVTGAFIVTFCGVAVPVNPPENPVNW